MTRILTFTLFALMLAGCADGYHKSAGINDCKPADHPAALFGANLSANNSLGGLPGRDLPIGSGRLLPNDISTRKCVPDGDDKGKEPLTGDLQKIGATHPFGIKPRPA